MMFLMKTFIANILMGNELYVLGDYHLLKTPLIDIKRLITKIISFYILISDSLVLELFNSLVNIKQGILNFS